METMGIRNWPKAIRLCLLEKKEKRHQDNRCDDNGRGKANGCVWTRDGGNVSGMEANAVEAHVLRGGELGEVGGSDGGEWEANAPFTGCLCASLLSL